MGDPRHHGNWRMKEPNIEKARIMRLIESNENKDQMIEIHPDVLKKIMEVPTLAKVSLNRSIVYACLGKGRIAYLLKSAKHERKQSNKPKEYPLRPKKMDKQKIEEVKKEHHHKEARRDRLEGEDMNVDSAFAANKDTLRDQDPNANGCERITMQHISDANLY